MVHNILILIWYDGILIWYMVLVLVWYIWGMGVWVLLTLSYGMDLGDSCISCISCPSPESETNTVASTIIY